ncbi:ATP-binding protein [Amycolatopsis sp. NPDC051903]|uniref:ATP-binding protein n=1 Tax=Amycolatopsis sp. NPDC051903 TaxID=3363936 RepID=UPI0037924E1D
MIAERLHAVLGRFGRFRLLAVSGTLGATSRPDLRDSLLKAAVDAPDGLIADISALDIPDPVQIGVFSLIARRIEEWPAVPFALVSERTEHRELLRERSVDRFACVAPDAGAAAERMARPQRQRLRCEIERSPNAGREARAFVRTTCAAWGTPEFADDAALVASELVENAVQHTGCEPTLQLDLSRGRCTVAVGDDNPAPALLRESVRPAGPGLGLRMVAQLARAWGSSPAWRGGKVVWAKLSARSG